MGSKISPDAEVHQTAVVGDGTTIWSLSQIREKAIIGENCVVGRGVYIGSGVVVGSNCKIQNSALLYEPAYLGQGVFIGPGVILTNDQYPRAVNVDFSVKLASDWEMTGVVIRDGASIGARSVCVAPIEIGRWALVAAGAVVTKDVPSFALMVGVPAKRIGWVGRWGIPLELIEENKFRCPKSGETYKQISLDELIEEVQ